MTNQLDQPTNKVAIAGHRSFIAQELVRQLGGHGKSVAFLAKGNLGVEDMTNYDCVYLVLGRAKPTAGEAAEEKHQVRDFLENPRKPRRAVYISSMSMSEHKLYCENLIREYSASPDGSRVPIFVLRPGAVFGPHQDPDSRMLIPSMVRGGEKFAPNWPFLLTKFISVDDLALHLTSFSSPLYWDMNRSGQPDSMSDVPGTFSLTPHQMNELYRAFKGLERQLLWLSDP